MISDDGLDVLSCPDCAVMLQPVHEGLVCPECGYLIPAVRLVKPGFDGPSIE